jgi:hypothetical protein
MRDSDNLEAFVRRSLKAKVDQPDGVELQIILNQMSTNELQLAWLHFTASISFSRATVSVPDSKTTQQQACFQNQVSSYTFCPKVKDATRKYIVDRENLEQHVRTHLTRYIAEERQMRLGHRNRPLTIVVLLVALLLLFAFILYHH